MFLHREDCAQPGLVQAFSPGDISKEILATIVILRPPEVTVSSHGNFVLLLCDLPCFPFNYWKDSIIQSFRHDESISTL